MGQLTSPGSAAFRGSTGLAKLIGRNGAYNLNGCLHYGSLPKDNINQKQILDERTYDLFTRADMAEAISGYLNG